MFENSGAAGQDPTLPLSDAPSNSILAARIISIGFAIIPLVVDSAQKGFFFWVFFREATVPFF